MAKDIETEQDDESLTKQEYAIGTIIGLLILTASALLFYFNWDSTNTLGGIGRVGGGLLMFIGSIITFIGVAKGRTLYLSGTINGVEQTRPFWHKDTEKGKDKCTPVKH